MQHRLAAGAIVEDRGRILLVRHVRPGRYDFWVSPGGGVHGHESLREAAAREVLEETGLLVTRNTLAYLEELANPEIRQCKFWFLAEVNEGHLSVAAPEARSEHIVEAAWLTRAEMEGKTIFPPVVRERFWQDKVRGFGAPIHLELRHMEFW